MFERKNILVFPCGSEIALELYRALVHSKHFNLIGASSVDDHGRFVYHNYIGDVPFVTDENFIISIKEIVLKNDIKAIYPAMDLAITILKRNEELLGCKVISSPLETVEVCLSKSKTYNILKNYILTPSLFEYDKIDSFPVFMKPDVGYGSRGCVKINNEQELATQYDKQSDYLFCEYLTGDEYTVDCFTDRNRKLVCCLPRMRKRIQNGISVATIPVEESKISEFQEIINKINKQIVFRGAWFAQFKRNSEGKLCLLEIASRYGGSSSLFRTIGVNFAQLSLFDAFDIDIDIIKNSYPIEMDRALDNRYKIDIIYNEVFVDFDDCLLIDSNKVNTNLITYLYQCINKGIKISLLTRHKGDLNKKLQQLRIFGLFDRIIHIANEEKKSNYIDNKNSIFIDDSFVERKDVHLTCGIPVFSVDMIECLV
jgi:hypothetical protein